MRTSGNFKSKAIDSFKGGVSTTEFLDRNSSTATDRDVNREIDFLKQFENIFDFIDDQSGDQAAADQGPGV